MFFLAQQHTYNDFLKRCSSSYVRHIKHPKEDAVKVVKKKQLRYQIAINLAC